MLGTKEVAGWEQASPSSLENRHLCSLFLGTAPFQLHWLPMKHMAGLPLAELGVFGGRAHSHSGAMPSAEAQPVPDRNLVPPGGSAPLMIVKSPSAVGCVMCVGDTLAAGLWALNYSEMRS